MTPDLKTIPESYHKYISLVGARDINEAFMRSGQNLLDFLQFLPDPKWKPRYQENKWSVNETVQHLIDVERIFSYRALMFARGDGHVIPGFDQDAFAISSGAAERSKAELLPELSAVMVSTNLLYTSFNEAQLLAQGKVDLNSFSVIAIGYILAGHRIHHHLQLEERYC